MATYLPFGDGLYIIGFTTFYHSTIKWIKPDVRIYMIIYISIYIYDINIYTHTQYYVYVIYIYICICICILLCILLCTLCINLYFPWSVHGFLPLNLLPGSLGAGHRPKGGPKVSQLQCLHALSGGAGRAIFHMGILFSAY